MRKRRYKKSKLNKVKDFLTFRSKKVNNDSVYLDLDNDIPEVKKTFRYNKRIYR